MDTQQHRTPTLTARSPLPGRLGRGAGRPRGIALITTLAGFVVVTMLVLSFLTTQRSQHTLTGLALEKKACREAIRSVTEFCRFQIEGQESWGRLDESELLEPVEHRDATGNVIFRLLPVERGAAAAKAEFRGLQGDTYFEGSLPGEGITFYGSVTNNLANKSAHGTEPVGPKSALLKLRASRGEISETVDVLMRKAAFFDSTIATTGQVRIEAREIDFASADRLRNQIRSKSDIHLPPYQQIKFTPHPLSQSSEKGTVWASGDIYVNRDSSESMLLAASNATSGEFLSKAPTYYEVPQLRRSDVDSRSGKPEQLLDQGHYLFTELEVTFEDSDGNLHRQRLTVLAEMNERGEIVNFHFCPDDLALEPASPTPALPPDPLPSPSGSPLPSPLPSASPGPSASPAPSASPSASPPPPAGPYPMPNTVTSGTATPVPHPAREFELGGIKMQLGSRGSGAFELAAEFDYRVQGDLVLGGSNPASPATLTFVDHDPDPDFPEEGSLGASGSLTLGTNLVNCGKLVANVDVVLSPQDVAMNKREEGNDVAIFAGRDVTIAPFFGGSAAFRTADNRAFVFRGVIYAERNFQFLSDALYNSTLEYERNLFIEGAVVARRGEVHIQGNEKAQLKYNREYLDDLLEKTVESDQVQVEEMSWRPR